MRTAVLLVSLVFLAVGLISCQPATSNGGNGGNGGNGNGGDNADIVGTWNLVEYTVNGEPQETSEETIVFRFDGTGDYTEEGVTTAITWERAGNQVTITDAYGSVVTLSLEGNSLVRTISTGENIGRWVYQKS